METTSVFTVVSPDGKVFQFEARRTYPPIGLIHNLPPLTDDILPPRGPFYRESRYVAVCFEVNGTVRREWSPGSGRYFDSPQEAVGDAISRFVTAFWKG